jgi:hypothetical protein
MRRAPNDAAAVRPPCAPKVFAATIITAKTLFRYPPAILLNLIRNSDTSPVSGRILPPDVSAWSGKAA